MNISVIIPAYNRAHTLARALDSVFTQSLPPDEVIVVDDGSTDNTADLLAGQYPQVRVLRQSNQGVSAARNAGIRAAHGEWIAFLDSDDSWLPQKLEQQSGLIAHNPGPRLCHTEEIWVRRGVRVNAMKKHAKKGGRIFRDCLPLCVISPSSTLIRRDLLDESGLFDEDLPACEDYDLWLRICARESVLFVESPQITKFGGHEDQLSQKYWGMDRFRVQSLQKVIDSQILDQDDQLAAIAMLIRKAGILEGGARKRGKNETADYYHQLQLRYHPGADADSRVLAQ